MAPLSHHVGCWSCQTTRKAALVGLDRDGLLLPVPNPLSKYFHYAPSWWHRIEVMANHVVELLAPLLLYSPNRASGESLEVSAK
eukprot:scaffold9695_cov181-Amphora_coffeaeformis.AAC.7